ncbi:MAG TPA: hypothetical protein VIK57_03145 [Streptosporangiaceae bacterium]
MKAATTSGSLRCATRGAHHIEWIVGRCGHDPAPDKVCLSLGAAQIAPYRAVFVSGGGDYRVYQLRK